MTREQMWQKLERADAVDLLVIGGGIVGAGVARDATRRGLSVAVVEMDDLASGTSSRSSKLVHGGLRYLEQYEFGLVFESVSERRVLMDLAPHLVNPLGFLFPVYEGSRHNLLMIRAGMWLYDGLSLFRSPKRHRQLSGADVKVEEPALKSEGLKGAPLYYDCSTDDARLTLENALDAARLGAIVATHAKVEGFVRGNDGRLKGAKIRDLLGGRTKDLRARAIVNATGPWTDATIALTQTEGAAPRPPMLRPTKGVHIVVDHARLPVKNAVVCFHPDDGRVLFAIPWGEQTYVGTTDTDYQGDPADVAATHDDVRYLLRATSAYFPTQNVGEADVISTWAGLRPLIAEEGVKESQVSREHHIAVGQEGLITIAGGKLTTYRRMSAEIVDTAVRVLEMAREIQRELSPSRTDKVPLPGGEGWPEDDDQAKVVAQIVAASAGALDGRAANVLASQYGMRAIAMAERAAQDPSAAAPLVPGGPDRMVQVDVAIEEELAATLLDVLARRTQLYLRDRDQGLGAAEAVASRMASTLGWTPERKAAELEAYRAEVARSRRWRSEP
ncbi:MAG: glycerol-3-phosphate dehydrogenase [Sandaracinus sp.]